ncbi:MAG: DUF4974 domain-containing protein [Muribaculaceae bacterium]|nr:DUF4974 domain-containing protein [Muribaculaceae bacterium]
MDKYELVLDIIDHPDNYTEQELSEIMSDKETKELYDLLCKVDSSVSASVDVDVDKEWNDFKNKTGFRRRVMFFRGNRAASIIAVICTSIVAMAVGIAVTVAVKDHHVEKTSSINISEKKDSSAASEVANDSIAPTVEITESPETKSSPVLFEDAVLSEIMERIRTDYGVEVKFGNEDVAALHLYYKYDPSLDLDEIISQLNTFESINITRDENLLTID